MLKSLLAGLVAASPVVAQQAMAAASESAAEGIGQVLFTPRVLDRDGHCIVGFEVTYPEAIVPHARHIRVTTIWSEAIQDGVWPIPAKGPPDNFVRNADGTVTFTGGVNESVGGCDPELTARTLAIGPCAQGDCPPAIYGTSEDAERLGLREADY